ncbi:putative methyltransferase DDB_G0268948 isoform X1 [Ranitomeya variabilis]|uniref:putative methyltransferase DDB_G0268948 isoform X1 n=1 Tax=Ranitomeya variabilis TaxID=490064 RepID=UPI004057839A
MAVNFFKKMDFSLKYQKYMIPASDEIIKMVLSYVKVKTNGRPLEMALDVGCGTGRYTLPLAPHFKKVLGLDISESQLNLAKEMTLANNVTYMVAPAEKLPLKDASVDLVQAGLAAHFFTLDKFINESVRVLKTRGCLAVHAGEMSTELEYKNLSDSLNVVMSQVWDTLIEHVDKDKFGDEMFSRYQNLFNTIPLKDKERIIDIPVKFQMTIPEVIGFIQSILMFHLFKEKDVKGAEQFLTNTEKRFREILGEEADSARMNMQIKHYCVLACKN